MSTVDVREIFRICDTDGSGYLEKSELQSVLPHVDANELDELLSQLDTDGDGKISLSELEKGLHKLNVGIGEDQPETDNNNRRPVVKKTLARRYLSKFGPVMEDDEEYGSDDGTRSRSLSDITQQTHLERSLSHISNADEEGAIYRKNSTIDLFRSLESHNEAFQVYCHLAQEDETMLKKFELFLEEAMYQIKEKSQEKEELEKVFQEEQKKQKERLAALEEEAETMTRKIELRTAQQLESKYEAERLAYEEELVKLRDELEKTRNHESRVKKEFEVEMMPLKAKLTDMEKTLRKIESEKTEAETNALLAKSQLAAYKQNMELHSAEREKDKEVVLDYMAEQVTLARQVKDLQEANRHLQENNADLQGEVGVLKRKLSQKGSQHVRNTLKDELSAINDAGSEQVRRGSRPQTPTKPKSKSLPQAVLSLSEEIEIASNMSTTSSSASLLLNAEDQDDHISSGLSSSDYRDDTDSPTHKTRKSHRRKQRSKAHNSHIYRSRRSSSGRRSVDDMGMSPLYNHSPSSEFLPYQPPALRPSNLSLVASPTHRQNSLTSNHSSITEQRTRDLTPQRVYKIVFAGDAGVGKSSFILHLCKGVFQNNIASTLGIDFHAKNMDVDDTRITLQLWDTAGQERFRSISASYFRKADGVILLYDSCSERSFVSMREWVSLIKDNVDTDEIPIVICANKIDLREEKQANGFKVITTEMGENLAEKCKTMFCEVSAKTGEKLDSTVVDLARAMKLREDEGLRNFEEALYLHKPKENEKKTSKKCC